MEKSEKVPEFKVFSTTNASDNSPQRVTVNQIRCAVPHHARFAPSLCKNADHFCQTRSHRGGDVSHEFRSQQAADAQRVELMQHGGGGGGGATPAWRNLHHRPGPGETGEGEPRGRCCCVDCGPNRSANRDTTTRRGDEYHSHTQSDEEDLEPPLPLIADDEWQHYRPPLPPQHYMNNYDLHRTMDVRCFHSEGEMQYNLSPVNRYPPPPCHLRKPWDESQNWLRCNGDFIQGSVSVNVPQFSVPPEESVSKVSVMNLSSGGAEASVSHPQEKRRTISLPDECRNIFITYSSDLSSEIVPFVDFLTKHGFRPAIDIFDSPVRCMDVNKWKDSYLKDPSTLIIIAISPKYKADIKGSVVDSHGLHTKYIHSMIQNEFIQQGSLNFRFIPLLFFNASQKDIPCWLQNTRVYRWPHDTEDLLLRLLREERYLPPPVPLELTLIIRPVTPSAAATL